MILLGGPSPSGPRPRSFAPEASAKELLRSEPHGRRGCSRLKWPSGGGNWLLPAAAASGSLARRNAEANNESIESQWPQRRGDGWCVIALTKSLAKELADTLVRVNCVTPAAVRTPLFAQMTQAHIDYMLSKIPLGRLGEPQEIAALVAWLASEECSFSTGAVFDLSGGRSTH